MKKTVSILLCSVMLIGMIAAMGIPTFAANDLAKTYDAAADGDVLYNALFGQTTGVYQSAVLEVLDTIATTTTATPSADGTSVAFAKTTTGRFYYGGKIDGLKLGADKKYTIVIDVASAMQNIGFYFNCADTAAQVKDFYNGLFGYYGCPQNWKDATNETLCYGGSKTFGLYRSDAVNYSQDAALKSTDNNGDGYFKLAIEVDGYSYSVFKEGAGDTMIFFDKGYINPNTIFDNIGITFYLYNKDAVTVKNAVVYKGLSYSKAAGFSYPATMRAGASVPDYTAATTYTAAAYKKALLGQKLLDVNFKNTKEFSPATYYSVGTDATFTISADGKTLSVVKGAETAGATYWGSEIGDLTFDANTKYTFTYKIKTNTGNSGVFFNFNETVPDLRYNCGIYGTLMAGENRSVALQRGATRLAGEFEKNDYSKLTLAADADGYVDLALEIDGLKYTAYIKDATGKYVKFNSHTLNDYEYAFGSNQLGFSLYIYNKNATLDVTDVALYKGTLANVLDPESPKTGDSAVYYAGAGALALLAVLGMGYVSKKRVSVK